MSVGDDTMGILSNGFLEQMPIRREVGTSASDGTDDIAGSPGAAQRRGVRIADRCRLCNPSDEGWHRHVASPRFPLERGVQPSSGSLTAMAFMDGW